MKSVTANVTSINISIPPMRKNNYPIEITVCTDHLDKESGDHVIFCRQLMDNEVATFLRQLLYAFGKNVDDGLDIDVNKKCIAVYEPGCITSGSALVVDNIVLDFGLRLNHQDVLWEEK